MSVTVEEYNTNWPQQFDELRIRLEKILEGIPYVSVEHVGSTSVPGLAAKPIIDIDIVVKRENLEVVINVLVTKGTCDYIGELGITNRHVFKDPNQDVPHNLYVCVEGCVSLRNHLALRDTLRTHSDLRDEYANVKLDLATQSTNIIDYLVAKTAIVLKILAQSNAFSPDELSAISKANEQGQRFTAFRTPRVLLREFVSKDIEAYYELESNERNARYQSWEPRTREEARKLVLDNIRSQNESPRTVYELAVEHDGAFVGRVGAKTRPANVDSLPGEETLKHVTHVDLWFSFLPAVQGQGFATEAMGAFMEKLSERLLGEGKLELEIECDPRNEGSWKLAERLGFERFQLVRGAWECKGEWVDSLVYRKFLGDMASGARHVRRESVVSIDGRDAFAATTYAPKGTGQS